ncbi:hypothetical protein D3C80_1876360 [compost metagenome]
MDRLGFEGSEVVLASMARSLIPHSSFLVHVLRQLHGAAGGIDVMPAALVPVPEHPEKTKAQAQPGGYGDQKAQ